MSSPKIDWEHVAKTLFVVIREGEVISLAEAAEMVARNMDDPAIGQLFGDVCDWSETDVGRETFPFIRFRDGSVLYENTGPRSAEDEEAMVRDLVESAVSFAEASHERN